ncbi:hypothetical protein A8W25_00475 [Streptomyces sp. ERV7]|uniref:hypothetical protein n=1 Tax=Streptomyces sp. ERV7 TaxID=1322334 RepID=UPI0007F40F90|nr:hypothetical protein [Streptomyces sp. ERV7]OAR26818.1 hypothetical protein A8W25_00475 [Streptomyces sp. ERV7]
MNLRRATAVLASSIALGLGIAVPSATASPTPYSGDTTCDGSYGSVTYDYGQIRNTGLYWVKLTSPFARDYNLDGSPNYGTEVWAIYTDSYGHDHAQSLVKVGPGGSGYGDIWSTSYVKDLHLYVSDTDGSQDLCTTRMTKQW